jgi:4-diphosphocytidyl-2-C-methyl-D-erythritol kinase
MIMISLKAYAKINIGLRIIGKRGDGYHDIETIFHRVNPYDEIILEPSSEVTLACTHPDLPTDERNLCIQAAQLLIKYTGEKRGVHISLTKNIPVGAGLGGGSTDAAATLIGLKKLWNLNIDNSDLNNFALQLGSDVPYFLKDGTAHARGRGEILDYFELPLTYWILIVYPDIHISTTWAYEQIKETHEHRPPASSGSLREAVIAHINAPQELAKFIFNDFEPVILHQNEIMRFCKISLYAAGAKFAQMSGSGSAFYGFFTDEATALTATELFSKKYKVFITPPL